MWADHTLLTLRKPGETGRCVLWVGGALIPGSSRQVHACTRHNSREMVGCLGSLGEAGHRIHVVPVAGTSTHTAGYKIPRGGLFSLVSCANYTAEILEWAGYATASGFALAPCSFSFFVFCNLAPRGAQHHAW